MWCPRACGHMRLATRIAILTAITSMLVSGSQLPVRVYTTADGLASNRINKIVQDSQGYLWFCTAEGLSRFDGYSFTNYGARQGLPVGNLNDLLEMPTGEYWLATRGGLIRFDPTSLDHKFRIFSPGDGGVSNFIALLADRSGGLWCGTYQGLYRFEHGETGDPKSPGGWRFRRVNIGTPEVGLEPARINQLVQDQRGALWIAAESGLYRLLPNGESERFTTTSGLPRNQIKTLLVDHLGRLWAGTQAGLCRVATDRAAGQSIVERIFGPADGLVSNDVYPLFESSSAKLWAGTYGGLSELLSEPLEQPLEKVRAFRSYTMANGLSSVDISSVTEDRNGNIWVGSSEGAMKITQSNFSTFTAADGLPALSSESPSVRVTSIFQDRSGALYVTVGRATDTQRHPFLSRLEGDRFKSIFPNLPPGVAQPGSGHQQTALQDRAGDWWIATEQGLVRFAAPARFEQLSRLPVKAMYTPNNEIPAGHISRIFEDSRGDIWIATFPRGLTRWDRRTASFQRNVSFLDPTPPPQPGDLFIECVSAFGEDRAGDVWIGLYRGGVVRFRNGKFVHFGQADGVGAGGVDGIHCDRAGRLWIGTTRSGVTRIDSPESDRPRFTSIGVQQGLSSAQVVSITEDRWGRIYVCGGRGIDRLDPSAPNGGAVTKHFTTADGVAGGNFLAAIEDGKGNLWFGTTLGLSRLVPEADPPPTSPRVLISGVRIRGVPYPVSDLGVAQLSGIRLRPDQTQLEVSFLGLSFAAGEVLRYQFMLADADRDWGPLTAERTVNYASLKPGSYRFLVRAVNAAGISAPVPASLAFTLLPPVWQRWWFLVLCACLGLSALYAVYRLRVGRLLHLERIRTRIATDLHDDIGASLSQIAIVSEALSRRTGVEHQFQEPLSQIATDSREMVTSMSDLVWSIDPRRDRLHDLVQRMRRFSGDMFAARDIRSRFSAPSSDLLLSIEQRRHLYLIFKEGVNNIVRHSACSEVEIGLSCQENALVLQVKDNGCGFDLSESGQGNGLSGMRARAAALGGTVEIAAARNGGTTLTLRVPLSRMRSSRWRPFFHADRW